MLVSESAHRLKELINKAMEDHQISRDEYDHIIHLVMEDGHIDPQERALLAELQDMIENRMVRLVSR